MIIKKMPPSPQLYNLDLKKIIYLLFRLFPIILPSYFVLSSIFSMDVKGVFYLAGLFIAAIATVLSANFFKKLLGDTSFNTDELKNGGVKERCEIISLAGEGELGSRLSPHAPLSQVVYTYTFFYLLFIIHKYGLWIQNVITVILFALLIVTDIIWNSYNNCNTWIGISISTIIGSGWGYSWAKIIDSSGAVNLQYFNGLSNRTVCTRPSMQTFVCTDTRSL